MGILDLLFAKDKPKEVKYPQNIGDETLTDLLNKKMGKAVDVKSEDFKPVPPIEKYGKKYK